MVQLIIPDEPTLATFTVTTPQSSFPFTFAIFNKADLHVSVAGVELSQTDFTLTGSLLDGGGYQGGIVVLNTPVSSTTCVIWRRVVTARAANFSPSGNVPVRDIDTALNRAMAIDQDVRRDVQIALAGTGAGGAVTSVNGQSGAVVLSASDVGAADESHSHSVSQVAGLQADLDAKAPLSSPALTGVPTAPTAAGGTNTTQIATMEALQTAIGSLGGGVTLATTGTAADLGVAARGVAATAARSDHVHKIPTLTDLGAADIHLTTVTTADMRAAMIASGAILLSTGVTETALPASARANKVLSFDGGGHPTFTDPAAGGGGGVTSVNGNVGAVTVSAVNIQAVPQASFRIADFYGALNGNNSTDNKTTIDLVRAGSDGEVRWPGTGADTYYTTNVITDFANMRMRGASKLRTVDGNNMPADFRLITTKPAVGTGADVLYDFSGDLRHTDATYTLLGGSVRRDLDAAYFESTVTPKFHHFLNNSGGGGVDADIVAKTASDTIKVNLSYPGSTELAAGQTLAIFSGMDGSEIYRGVVLAVTVAGANSLVQFTTALPGTVPAGSVLARSKRTMAMANYTRMVHNGRGDAYAYISRVSAAVALPNGVRHFFGGKTVANFGGDMTLDADGAYGTYMEHIATAATADTAFWGWVQSFIRNNDTGARGVGWGGIFFKSEGTRPADVGFRMAGGWRVGLDLVAADFSSNAQAAIQLSQTQRIYLDGTNPTSGRGTDPGVVWPPFYSNNPGSTYFSVQPLGVTDGRGKRLEFIVNGALSGAGYGVLNLRGAAVEAHKPVNVYDNSGNLGVTLDPATPGVFFGNGVANIQRSGNALVFTANGGNALAVDYAGRAVVVAHGDLKADAYAGTNNDRGGNGRVYVGSNSWIDFDGTSMVFFCNGVAKFAIDPTYAGGFYKL